MSSQRVLVTGADGFIGSHVVEQLVVDGHEVRALAYYNSFGTGGWLDTLAAEILGSVEVVMGDVRDAFQIDRIVAGRDVVFHLAALIGIPYSYVAPKSYLDTNVAGTLNVLEAARRHDIEHLVHTSTSEVYGTALFTPMTEDHPLQAQSPYAATKVAADQLALSYHRSFELPVTVLRPFNTYGPRQSARAVIPTVTMQALAGKGKVRLGSTHPTRDFNYVKDIARAFALAGSSRIAVGKVVNLGSNFEISIGEMVEVVGKVVGISLEVEVDSSRIRPDPSEVDRLWADNTRAAELLSWEPEFGGRDGFERGIEQTVGWFSDPKNRNSYSIDRYMI